MKQGEHCDRTCYPRAPHSGVARASRRGGARRRRADGLADGGRPPGPTAPHRTANPAVLPQPVFFVSTYGFWDSIIASPATEKAYYLSTSVHAALGIILTSDGKLADHTSIQDTADGGNPGGFFGYATAWLEYQLRGDATAAGAFSGPHPELLSNINWPGSAVK